MEQPATVRPWHRVSGVDDDAGTGVCSLCGPVKVRYKVGKRYYECGTLTRRYRLRQQSKPGYTRKEALRRKYGMTLDAYDELYALAGGACEICRDPLPILHVDHNHDSGEVRGLLCPPCNKGLGHFKDNPAILTQAIEYLTKARSATRADDGGSRTRLGDRL